MQQQTEGREGWGGERRRRERESWASQKKREKSGPGRGHDDDTGIKMKLLHMSMTLLMSRLWTHQLRLADVSGAFTLEVPVQRLKPNQVIIVQLIWTHTLGEGGFHTVHLTEFGPDQLIGWTWFISEASFWLFGPALEFNCGNSHQQNGPFLVLVTFAGMLLMVLTLTLTDTSVIL